MPAVAPAVSTNENVSADSPKEKKSLGKMEITIIVTAVVIALAVVGIVAGVCIKSAIDAESTRAASAEIVSGWQEKIDAISADSSVRTEMLANYVALSDLEAAIDAARDADELKLPNGKDADLSDVKSSISSKQMTIRKWFVNDYETRLATGTLPDNASADNTTREIAQAAADVLLALKADIEKEKAIWGVDAAGSTDNGTTYSSLIARIDVQAQKCADVLAQITAAEQAAKAASKGIGSVSVGSHVNLGTYEQDGNSSNGKEDIEWRVLDVQNGKALLISEMVLDCKPYNSSKTSVTWSSCSLRSWLNGTFYNTAFSSDAQKCIIESTLSNSASASYGNKGGPDTTDKVFLLSIDEANSYFSSDNDRIGYATAYALTQGLKGFINGCACWLRSSGYDTNRASCVSVSGDVRIAESVNSSQDGVRPAIWVSM